MNLTTAQLNLAFAVLFLGGMVVIFWRQWRSDRRNFLPYCCAAVSWFMLVNEAYSVQYDLWVVVLLAVAGMATSLAIAWSASAVLTFWVSFTLFAMYDIPGANE